MATLPCLEFIGSCEDAATSPTDSNVSRFDNHHVSALGAHIANGLRYFAGTARQNTDQ